MNRDNNQLSARDDAIFASKLRRALHRPIGRGDNRRMVYFRHLIIKLERRVTTQGRASR